MRLIYMSVMDSTSAALPPPPLPSSEQLPDDLPTLKRMVLQLLESLDERDRDILALRHRLDLLLQYRYGPRTERLDPNQLLLFAERIAGQDTDTDTATPTEPASQPAAKPKRRCQPHGRGRLPEHLRREPKHHLLTEAQRLCPGCGQLRVDIGTDKSEQLDYRPASLFVIAHFVHKYACPCCSQRLAQGEPPPATQGAETQPMPAPPSQPQPAGSLPTEPTATPAPSDTQPEPASVSAPSSDQGQAPQAPPPPLQLVEPSSIVIAASKPPMPIAKGLPAPGLLAHLIVSKFVDHLPLHRLERVYERQGHFLHRSTLCDWLAACAQLLEPLYQLLVSVVLQSRSLHTDDTTVKMQEMPAHLLRLARLWVYLGDAAHPYNVFDFTVNRKRDGPQLFLAKYQGYLHADAFSGYDGLYLPDPATAKARIIEVACNAHARRKFYEARGSDGLGSHRALAYYRQLYELERSAQNNDFSDTQRLHMRQELSLPILEKFQQWLEVEQSKVLPKSPMAEAIGYALNNWTALVRYTEAGFLTIDNNVSEREMKRIAIGRKNWLFVGSPEGGKTAAVLMSFTSTCTRLGVEPWAYLHEVLTRLPALPAGQLGELLPDHWQAARQAKRLTPPAAATDTTTPPAESES
jgi:transposase